jgi:hypothetical protein
VASLSTIAITSGKEIARTLGGVRLLPTSNVFTILSGAQPHELRITGILGSSRTAGATWTDPEFHEASSLTEPKSSLRTSHTSLTGLKDCSYLYPHGSGVVVYRMHQACLGAC